MKTTANDFTFTSGNGGSPKKKNNLGDKAVITEWPSRNTARAEGRLKH